MKGNNDQYARMGIAAMLPGMVRAHEVLGEEIERLRTLLGEVDGRPPREKTRQGTASWAGMSPEERSVEMKRRRAVAEKKREQRARIKVSLAKPAAVPVADTRATWRENIQQSQKKRWARMTKAERKAVTAKLQAARTAARAARSAERAAA